MRNFYKSFILKEKQKLSSPGQGIGHKDTSDTKISTENYEATWLN